MARFKVLPTFVLAGIALIAGGPSRAAPEPAGPEPVATYRTYASAQAAILVRMTRMLAKDIHDGDVRAAQNDYAATHRYLERIRPVLAQQGDLATALNVEAAELPGREADPAFSGFHRIEHALYAAQSTRDLAAHANRLYADTLRLQARVETMPIRPAALAAGPADLIEMVSARVPAGGREPYSGMDLWDIEADVDGAEAMVAAIRPVVAVRDPLLLPRIDAAFAKARERLAQFRDGCGFKTYDRLTHADRTSLEAATVALARELAKLEAVPAIDRGGVATPSAPS